MKRCMSICGYFVLGMWVIVIDRITKAYALKHFILPCQIHKCVTAALEFNRGISWGMLTFQDPLFFMVVSCLVMLVTALLALYAVQRWNQGHYIIGEVLVLAGSCSNVADRFWYGGVVDFIIISYNTWSWPVFNIADACIVTGVVIMCLQEFQEPR